MRALQVVTELSSRRCSFCREPTSGFFTLTCSRVCQSCFKSDSRVKMCSLRCAQLNRDNRISLLPPLNQTAVSSSPRSHRFHTTITSAGVYLSPMQKCVFLLRESLCCLLCTQALWSLALGTQPAKLKEHPLPECQQMLQYQLLYISPTIFVIHGYSSKCDHMCFHWRRSCRDMRQYQRPYEQNVFDLVLVPTRGYASARKVD